MIGSCECIVHFDWLIWISFLHIRGVIQKSSSSSQYCTPSTLKIMRRRCQILLVSDLIKTITTQGDLYTMSFKINIKWMTGELMTEDGAQYTNRDG